MVPKIEPALAAMTDMEQLQSLLDSEMYTGDMLEEERLKLANALAKERMVCAALNVQIRQLDGASKVWNYRLEDAPARSSPKPST